MNLHLKICLFYIDMWVASIRNDRTPRKGPQILLAQGPYEAEIRTCV